MLAAAREHTIPGWTELETEFDAWSALGKRATFWWRDDDATRTGPRLDRLLAIANERPLSLAVIPAQATPELAQRLKGAANITVLQHGYAHTNHAPRDEKKSEFGNHRAVPAMRSDLTAGKSRLKALFGERFFHIFVPPWNRFANTLPTELAVLEFAGLSAFGPRAEYGVPGVMNCHADIINWRGGRGFLGTEAVLEQIIGHLAMRRSGKADLLEPTGLLTHHRDHDPDCWRFIECLLQAIDSHPATAWRSPVMEFPGARQ
ncbi:MAG: hypothetical protein GKS00_05090 [Alphaproteobacteria bacterium]|nr:hypothetical protein [Alphaproteobacteria bacterium]